MAEITSEAHGLKTGDGPIRVTNSGGPLPDGLVASKDYYVKKIDSNTLILTPRWTSIDKFFIFTFSCVFFLWFAWIMWILGHAIWQAVGG